MKEHLFKGRKRSIFALVTNENMGLCLYIHTYIYIIADRTELSKVAYDYHYPGLWGMTYPKFPPIEYVVYF